MAGTAADLFEKLFSAEALSEVFTERFYFSRTRGIDRQTGPQFARASAQELSIISQKVLSGTYRFTPYAEVLRAKGRDKAPRLIGIPTLRDRIVLYQITRLLSDIYPEQVPKNLAKKTITSIVERLSAIEPCDGNVWLCTTDIKTFYDSIDRERLLKVLGKEVNCSEVLSLIRRALITPIVPRGSLRKDYREFRRGSGVPQGLSVSNILAAIYLMDVDEPMASSGVSYWRYVDDVLMMGPREAVISSYSSLRRRLRLRSLELHRMGSNKTKLQIVESRFSYLGYQFVWPKITVKNEAVERYLVSIAAKFSEFANGKVEKLKTYAYLNEERLKEIFILEINDRISGAISGHRRYGWIAYYNGINDLALLRQMDYSISKMFRRLSEFEKRPPAGLKKLTRSYFEMKYRPLSGYVRNYDAIVTIAQKIQFLEKRGILAPQQEFEDAEVDRLFSRYRRSFIDSMQADEGSIYAG